jgi:hypothetical protein
MPKALLAKPKKKSNAGRPTIMTPEVIAKLEELFLDGCHITLACTLAGISPNTYYDFINANHEYAIKFDMLRHDTTYRALKNIKNKIQGVIRRDDKGNIIEVITPDADMSKWWLERKSKDEFSTKTEVESHNTNVNVESYPNELKPKNESKSLDSE